MANIHDSVAENDVAKYGDDIGTELEKEGQHKVQKSEKYGGLEKTKFQKDFEKAIPIEESRRKTLDHIRKFYENKH